MSDVVYRSQVRVEKVQGVLRRAFLPAEREPVRYGVHDEVARHYGIDPSPEQTHATTLDHVVAAAAG